MGHHKKPKRKGFLTGYFDEFEDLEEKADEGESYINRITYMIEAPKLLEKAWKMPFREDKEAYLRPVVCLAELENLDERIEKSNDTCMAILEAQGWFLRNKSFEKKDWRDFK